LLQIPRNTSTRLYEIDSAIEEAIRNKERPKLGGTPPLEKLSLPESTSSTTRYWITGLSICILMIIIICCYHRGSITKKCRERWIRGAYGPTSQPRPRPRRNFSAQLSEESVCTVNTVLPLHVLEPTVEGEEEAGEMETDVATMSREPTLFVQRGRVPAV
jgi:hypothetical protein